MKFFINTLLIFITLGNYAAAQTPGNDCASAPMYTINNTNSNTGSFTIYFDWNDYTSSETYNSSPKIERYPSWQYGGRDFWVTFNSGDIEYLQFSTSSDYFNIFSACGGEPLESIELGFTRKFYELQPNTTYYLQGVLQVNQESIQQTQNQLNDRTLTIGYQKVIDNNDCSSATNLALSLGQVSIERPEQLIGALYYSVQPSEEYYIRSPGISVRDNCNGSYLEAIGNYYKLDAGQNYILLVPRNENGRRIWIEVETAQQNIDCNNRISINLGEINNVNAGFYPYNEIFRGNSAFYEFVAPSSGAIIVSEEDVEIYQADCNNLVEYTPNRYKKIYGLIPGQIYYAIVSTDRVGEQFSISEIPSPVANNACDFATIISPSPTVVHSVDFINTSLSPKAGILSSLSVSDVWYELNASDPRSIIRYIQGSSTAKRIKLFRGSTCSSAQEVSNIYWSNLNQDQTLNTPSLNAGEKYFLNISSNFAGFNINSDIFEFSFEGATSSGNTPINDNCSNAIPYTSLPSGEPSLPETSIPFCNQQDSYLGNWWYTFTPITENSLITVPRSTTIFTGDCNSLMPVECFENSPRFPEEEGTKRIVLIPGQEYLISTPNPNFVLQTRANNDSGCDNATELVEVIRLTGIPNTTGNAYGINDPKFGCLSSSTWTDSWFRVNMTGNYNTLLLSSANSSLTYALYNDDCSNLTEIYCGSVSQFDQVKRLLLNQNQSYLLRIVGSVIPQNGYGYSFSQTPVENDDCSLAPEITIGETLALIDRNIAMTPSSPNFSCASEALDDLWKSFTAPASGKIYIERDNPNNSANYFTELYSDCNTPVPGSCQSYNLIYYENLNPSSTYYLRTSTTDDPEDQIFIYTEELNTNGDCSQALSLDIDDCITNTEGNSLGDDNGVWFKTTVPSSGAFTFRSNTDFFATIYAGDCANIQVYSSVSSQGNTLVEGIPVGEEVFIKIFKDQLFDFCLLNAFSEGSPNSFCEYSIELVNISNEECNVVNEVVIRDHRKNNTRISWYYFNATTPNMEVSAEILTRYLVIPRTWRIYDSCSGERIHQGLATGSISLTDLTVGQDYYLEIETEFSTIGDDSSQGCQGDNDASTCIDNLKKESRLDLAICIKENPIPAVNDLCADAISLALSDPNCSSSLQDSTNNAYDDFFDCNYGSKEVWYSFSANPDGGQNITVKLENNAVPLQVAVFEESCEGRQIVCARDSAIIVTKPGFNYYIAVSRTAEQENSSFQICVKELVINGSENNIGVDIDNPVVKLQVNGGISVGESDANLPGSIRYDGVDFQGFTAEGWKSFSQLNDLSILDQAKDNLGNHQAGQDLNLSGFNINQLADPEYDNDAANKKYVDEIALGIKSMIADSLNNVPDTSQFDAFRNGQLVQVDDPNSGGKEYELQWEANGDTVRVDVSELWDLWYNDLDNVVWTEYPVGIYTDSPEYDLDVAGTIQARDAYRLKSNGDVNAVLSLEPNNALTFDVGVIDVQSQTVPKIDFASLSSIGFTFDILNKRIGIGNSNPGAGLHLDKNSGTDYLRIDKNGTTETVIDGDGYLGIGISNPQKELDVEGTVQIKKNSSSGNPHLNLIEDGPDFVRLNMTNSTNSNIVIAALPSTTLANAKINFNIEGAGDVMTVAGNDRVGINDNSPDYTLDVEAQGGANPFRVGTSSASETYLKILSSGYAGIGGDPSSDLHVHHDNTVTENGLRIENNSSSNHWRMFVSSGGDLRLYNDTQNSHIGKFDYASGAYSTNSDRRLKDGISDLHFNWEKFMSLNPSNYYFKSDQKKRKQLGLIAQDVEKVYPEIVYKNEESGMYKMDYSGTGVIAIKAVQELKKENEILEQEIITLKKEMNELKQLISNLKN